MVNILRLFLLTLFRQLVGIMAALEQFTVDADERGNQFIQRLLQKQSQRLGGLFTRLVVSLVTPCATALVCFLACHHCFPVVLFRREYGRACGPSKHGHQGFVLNSLCLVHRLPFQPFTFTLSPGRSNQIGRANKAHNEETERSGVLHQVFPCRFQCITMSIWSASCLSDIPQSGTGLCWETRSATHWRRFPRDTTLRRWRLRSDCADHV